jgi:phage/plasmid-associated DNA primase
MDVLAAFLRECCVLDKRAEARASDLFSAYKGWCKANFEHAESQKGFGTRLGERGLTSRKSHGRMIYQGIGLLAGEDGEDGDRVSVSHTRANLYIEEPRSRSPSSPSSSEDGDRHCWSCRGAIDDDDADRCPTCGWFICSCGACDPECSERDSGRL